MRDLLGRAAWENRFPNNPTQTIFRRFIHQPYTEIHDTLKDTRERFDSFGKKALHTHLSEYLED
jgi:hypothetical protein